MLNRRFLLVFCTFVLLPSAVAMASNPGQKSSAARVEDGGFHYRVEHADTTTRAHADSLYQLGVAKLKLGDASTAEELLTEALLLGAEHADAPVQLADAYLKQGKLYRVVNDLPVATQRSPEAAEVMGYQAVALLIEGNTRQASALLETALSAHPGALMPRAARTRLLIDEANYDAAIDIALALTDDYPESARAWEALGFAAQARRDHELAIDAYGRALALDAHLLQVRVTRTRLLVYLGRDEESWADLDFLEYYYPAEPRAAYVRAMVFERGGATALATDEFRYCALLLSRLPQHWIAQSAQLTMEAATAHLRLGEAKNARDYLAAYHQLDRNNLAIAKRLALVEASLGQSSKL